MTIRDETTVAAPPAANGTAATANQVPSKKAGKKCKVDESLLPFEERERRRVQKELRVNAPGLVSVAPLAASDVYIISTIIRSGDCAAAEDHGSSVQTSEIQTEVVC